MKVPRLIYEEEIKILKPEIFQGKNKIKKNKHYFEGWYFKLVSKELDSIAFIPGIALSDKDSHAFIQINMGKSGESHYLTYPLDSFKYSEDKFEIFIGDNYFSENIIKLNIKELKIFGEIKFSFISQIKKSFLAPNIMGIFSYFPNMECNHGIINVNSVSNGYLKIKENLYNYNEGTAYLEKDWGISFPEKWIWTQGNNFLNKKASFVFSIAKVPFFFSSFEGFFAVLALENMEFKFTTYNFSRVKKLKIFENRVEIEIFRGKYKLDVEIIGEPQVNLKIPTKGEMHKNLKESIDSKIIIKLYENKELLFEDESLACGFEIYKYSAQKEN